MAGIWLGDGAAPVGFPAETDLHDCIEKAPAITWRPRTTMPELTHRERIIATLRRTSKALDDDQLSDRTGIRPRQAVNQICRALERAGILRRRPGSDGKLVNELVSKEASGPLVDSPSATVPMPTTPAPAEAIVSPSADPRLPPGSSQEQRDAERVMLDLLSEKLGRHLAPARITIPSGVRVEVDGADVDRTVLVECWAHQGPPKSAQQHKVR